MHLYACASVIFFWHSYQGDVFLVMIPKRTGSIVGFFFASFPFTYTMYMPQHMPFFQISHVYQGIDIPLFCHRRRVYAASLNISCLFGYKPKKMVVTVGLQNIISMYITLKTSYVFILCVYYLKIKLTGFCQCRPMYINCGAAIVPFITRVYACKIQSA